MYSTTPRAATTSALPTRGNWPRLKSQRSEAAWAAAGGCSKSLAMYVAPTGNYFKNATEGLRLNLEKVHARAMRGGFGAVKCSGNYAVCLLPLSKTKKAGFSDNIYLELETFHAGIEVSCRFCYQFVISTTTR